MMIVKKILEKFYPPSLKVKKTTIRFNPVVYYREFNVEEESINVAKSKTMMLVTEPEAATPKAVYRRSPRPKNKR